MFRVKQTYPFEPDYRVPPGETLKELMDLRSYTELDVAVALGMSPVELRRMVEGASPVTPEVAEGLEEITGLPAQMWLNLEANYRKAPA